ncbi:MAG: single-stranded DNA-binding protein [Bacteroidales bacterium]|jgi:single-strand DNA-binding protein|nr:single-stranded DNA-binding protein [Bacteroidales bacterium]
MEFLNKLELRGVVGRADVNTYNGSHVCNFSVVTEASALDREGNSVVEPTWFNVTAWNSIPGLQSLDQVQKGLWVHVIGRLRIRKYTTAEGEERTSSDVLARRIEIIPREDMGMQPERNY